MKSKSAPNAVGVGKDLDMPVKETKGKTRFEILEVKTCRATRSGSRGRSKKKGILKSGNVGYRGRKQKSGRKGARSIPLRAVRPGARKPGEQANGLF